MNEKNWLRATMRTQRREHVAAIPDAIRALLFMRPPSPVAGRIAADATIGLYHPHRDEAPTLSYAKFFHDRGHALALPWFADRDAPMEFRLWSDPYDEDALAPGPFGVAQPGDAAPPVLPEVLFVPLVAFTASGLRLGQGGGHYDRWLAAHPAALRVGLAWDGQLVDSLPHEPHDMRLHAVITPTRLYEGHEDDA